MSIDSGPGHASDAPKDLLSPAPPYSSDPPSSVSIESLLSQPQLASLTQIYETLSPSGAAVPSKTLLVGLHQSR